MWLLPNCGRQRRTDCGIAKKGIILWNAGTNAQAYRTFLRPCAPGKKEISFHSPAVGRTKLCQMRGILQKNLWKATNEYPLNVLILRKKTEDCLQKNDRLVYFITVDPYEIRKEIRKEIPNREYRRTARPEKTIADPSTEPCFPAYLSARCTGSGSECGRRLLLHWE